MSLITRALRETAVLWAFTGVDAYGKPSVASPIEISCRWDDSAIEYIAPDNTNQVSRAVVMVDRDITIGGILMLGELTDVNGAVAPKSNLGAYEIRQTSKNPNLRATEYLRQCYL